MQTTNEIPAEILDVSSLVEHVGADMGLLGELVELFEQYWPDHLANIESAIDAEDASALREIAHQMKGAISNFYAPKAVAAAKRLEENGRNGDLADASTNLAVLRESVTELRNAMRILCRSTTES